MTEGGEVIDLTEPETMRIMIDTHNRDALRTALGSSAGTEGGEASSTAIISSLQDKNNKAERKMPPPTLKYQGRVEKVPGGPVVAGLDTSNLDWDGWMLEEWQRMGGSKTGKIDRYWYPPINGVKIRSMKDLLLYQNLLLGIADGNHAIARDLFKAK